jgi:hypothetical protein
VPADRLVLSFFKMTPPRKFGETLMTLFKCGRPLGLSGIYYQTLL